MSEEIAAESAPEAEISAEESSEIIEESTDEGIELSEGGESEDVSLDNETVEELKAELTRSLNLKIDGEDFTEELPFDATPEMIEYLTKQAQLAKMSNKRAQEAADLRKTDIQRNQEIQNFMEAIKEDPAAMLKQMGIDPKEFSEELLEKEVELMQMSESDRKIMELQNELADRVKAEENAKRESEVREQEALRDKYASEYEKDLMSALDASELPSNPELILRMNQYMKIALENGIDLNFNDILPLVSENVNSELTKLLSSTPIDKLVAMLGEDKVKGIRSSGRKKKVAPPTANSVKDTGSGKVSDKKKDKISMDDFFRNL